jgi:molecular chaperone GrpE
MLTEANMHDPSEIAEALDRFDARMRDRANEPNSEARPPTHLELLEERLRDADARVKEVQANHRAALEEMERAKWRVTRDAERQLRSWQSGFLASFIELLDDLDRAVAAAREHCPDDAVQDGLLLLQRRFLGKLAEHGVQRVEPRGARFDPYRHEAISIEPARAPVEDGVVVAVVAPGYVADGEVLRPARVVVARGRRADDGE